MLVLTFKILIMFLANKLWRFSPAIVDTAEYQYSVAVANIVLSVLVAAPIGV